MRAPSLTLLATLLATVLPALAYGADWNVVTSAEGQPQRFLSQPLAAPQASHQPLETELSIFVDSSRQYQRIFGFGGAITDASAEVFARLKPQAQQAFLDAYFSRQQGLGYSVLRTTIHSSDFSSASYTYVDEGDTSLRSFSIAADERYRLPLLRRALASAQEPLRVFASPWSAPGWMKSNGRMTGGGTLLPAYRSAWANYMVRFVQAYEAAGVPIWGMTLQNEPMATQRWESMILSADEEARFLTEDLAPALQRAGLQDKKLIVWDHNRDLLPQRARRLLDDPQARRYIWGVGFHWYETWTGGAPMHQNVAAVRAAWPDVGLLMTEATVEKYDVKQLQSWANAERYGSQILGDLNAGANGWVDWNMLLDMRGGPNHVGNYCFALLHASDDGELVFTPSYAYFGHFTRYIRPQAVRIGASSSRSALQTTAFRNPDGKLAIVVMNSGAQPLPYRLHVDGQELALTIPAHGIQTVLN